MRRAAFRAIEADLEAFSTGRAAAGGGRGGLAEGERAFYEPRFMCNFLTHATSLILIALKHFQGKNNHEFAKGRRQPSTYCMLQRGWDILATQLFTYDHYSFRLLFNDTPEGSVDAVISVLAAASSQEARPLRQLSRALR